jgi:hypothetical protein
MLALALAEVVEGDPGQQQLDLREADLLKHPIVTRDA